MAAVERLVSTIGQAVRVVVKLEKLFLIQGTATFRGRTAMAKLSDIKPIPLKSLLRKKGGAGSEIADAAVIIAQDGSTGSRIVTYGRELLEDLAREKARHALKVVIVEMDFSSDDLQRLQTLIDTVKGTPDTAAG